MTNPELLTPPEVAALLRCSLKALYSRVERGQIKGAVRLGGSLLFRTVDVRRQLGLSTTPPNDSGDLDANRGL